MKNLKEVSKYIIDNKGISFNPNLMDAKGNYLMPGKGYMVSDKGSELIMSMKDVKPLLKTCISKYAHNLQKNRYFGIWIDDQKCYFDISENVQDLKAAIIQGMKNGQKAIFDISNKKSIYLPGDQTGTEYQKKEYRKLCAEKYITKSKFY